MRNIFILSIVIIASFGLLDAMQIFPWQQSEQWEIYTLHVVPAILGMWAVTLLAIAIIYYLITKDKSAAVGIFVSAKIMMWGGLQDVFFFLLSPNQMTPEMCWFGSTQAVVSKILGEACVTPLSLILNATLFTYLAYIVLKWFWRQKW